MRVTYPAPPVTGPLTPLPTEAQQRESIAVTRCRLIATGVATALDTALESIGYRLTLRDDLPVPYLLHIGFTVRGHTVVITMMWHEPWQEPAFALTVDNRPVPLDTTTGARPAAVLAHAAWQAITDTDQATAVP
jgi:hypothetical protein